MTGPEGISAVAAPPKSETNRRGLEAGGPNSGNLRPGRDFGIRTCDLESSRTTSRGSLRLVLGGPWQSPSFWVDDAGDGLMIWGFRLRKAVSPGPDDDKASGIRYGLPDDVGVMISRFF